MGDNGSSTSALHRTAEQFHILVDSVEEYAIYMVDPDGNVVTWNTGAQKIKGYTAEEIIGKNFACFYTAEDVAAGKPQRNLREAARRGHIRDQGLRVRKDGTTFEAEVILTALRDAKGNIRGYSKVTRDITDQIRSRESEAEKIAAERASKAKDDFLAALSHELRTPLTPALAAATYLEDNAEKIPQEFVEDVQLIKRNVKLEARLIDDLLDLTRITRGKLRLDLETCDAHTIIRNAIDTASSATAAKKLKLSTKLNAKQRHIRADCIRLQQVFWNLINHAVKFTPPGGQIAIRTFDGDRGRFHFEITDNGIGIERERLASLFKPFEQADASVTRQFGGLGLGLAISKHLVDLHHGTIEAQSCGRSFGATFKVILDVLPEGVGKTDQDSRAVKRPQKPLRILLVEDHRDTRHMLSRLLTHFGHQVLTADNIRNALNIIASENVEVLLCDIGLPDGTGYEVIAEAKRKRRIKAVAITGFGTEEDIRRSKGAGFDFHLVKPVDVHELQTILDQVDAGSSRSGSKLANGNGR
ncbi:MAG: hybrid sensor histidine kinase/response regulator [Verrucomicrobia bacterium]|nr:MAG: hybrid sensor histidine kinase/response regulator [Verrucomicrobiota bacterium]